MFDEPIMPGPCCICGRTDYPLSMGGPAICPRCDCGHFDNVTVLSQAKTLQTMRADNLRQAQRMQSLEAENKRLRTVLKIARRHIPPGDLEKTPDGLRYVLDMITDVELGHELPRLFNDAAPPVAPAKPS